MHDFRFWEDFFSKYETFEYVVDHSQLEVKGKQTNKQTNKHTTF